jgi:SAM-dependent methyltransferase
MGVDYQRYIQELKSVPILHDKSRDELIHLYWAFHPRYKFFKSLPLYSKALDLGAGTGGLFHWKRWGEPNRDDIELFAVDQKKGVYFDEYKDFQICNLDTDPLKFEEGFFDAILISHVLEHLNHPDELLNKLHKILKVGGKVYVEMPSIQTLEYPKNYELSAINIKVAISNFFDDATHKKTFSSDQLKGLIMRAGFESLESGVIENDYLQAHLFSHGIANDDQETTTYGIWLKFLWAQYVIGQKFIHGA